MCAFAVTPSKYNEKGGEGGRAGERVWISLVF